MTDTSALEWSMWAGFCPRGPGSARGGGASRRGRPPQGRVPPRPALVRAPGGGERSKEPDLSLLGTILEAEKTPYAIIGGVALQVHQPEPRTTLDIDVALRSLGDLPRRALLEAGFRESWTAPEGTPVQFTDDPALREAVGRAVEVRLPGVRLRVLGRADLLHEKLRAGGDPARRRSKRLQDLADAHALLEQDPSLRGELSAAEEALLERMP